MSGLTWFFCGLHQWLGVAHCPSCVALPISFDEVLDGIEAQYAGHPIPSRLIPA
jgi:hypothetical protein